MADDQLTKDAIRAAAKPATPTEALPAFDCLVTMDVVGGIGRKGGMAWGTLQYDRAAFYDITTEVPKTVEGADKKRNVVIMGRTAWMALPQGKAPMPNRINIVISKDTKMPVPEGVYVEDSLRSALLRGKRLQESGDAHALFVVGGAATLNLAFTYNACRYIYTTTLLKHVPRCDVFVDPFHSFVPDATYPRKSHSTGDWEYMLHRLCRRPGKKGDE